MKEMIIRLSSMAVMAGESLGLLPRFSYEWLLSVVSGGIEVL